MRDDFFAQALEDFRRRQYYLELYHTPIAMRNVDGFCEHGFIVECHTAKHKLITHGIAAGKTKEGKIIEESIEDKIRRIVKSTKQMPHGVVLCLCCRRPIEYGE